MNSSSLWSVSSYIKTTCHLLYHLCTVKNWSILVWDKVFQWTHFHRLLLFSGFLCRYVLSEPEWCFVFSWPLAEDRRRWWTEKLQSFSFMFTPTTNFRKTLCQSGALLYSNSKLWVSIPFVVLLRKRTAPENVSGTWNTVPIWAS